MAMRSLRMEGDMILKKTSKPVEEINDKIIQLLDDMVETMYHHGGAGLAAVQVGVLRRIVVVDITEDNTDTIEFINPEIVHREGSQMSKEGCLSVDGLMGDVERPDVLIVRGLNRNGEEFEVRADEYLAVALDHELDHLDGVLYTEKAKAMFRRTDDDNPKKRGKKRRRK